MKLKIIILLVSLLSTTLLISGGYGYWHKDLTIKGNISVIKPVANNELLQTEQSKTLEGMNELQTEPGKVQENPPNDKNLEMTNDQEENKPNNSNVESNMTSEEKPTIEKAKNESNQSPEITKTGENVVPVAGKITGGSNENTEPSIVSPTENDQTSINQMGENK